MLSETAVAVVDLGSQFVRCHAKDLVERLVVRIVDTVRRSSLVHGKNLSVGNATFHKLARPDESHEPLLRSRLSATCRILARPLPERRDILLIGGEVLPMVSDELENVGQRSIRLRSSK